MGEKQVVGIVAVPVFREHRRYLVLTKLVVVALWVGDIVVVGDTAVLSRLAMVGREQGMHLIFVADIRGKERCTEVGGALVLIVTSGIVVVEVETDAQPLVGIDSKFSVDMVFTVLLVATVVVA